MDLVLAQIEGIISEIIYTNEENGYTVCVVSDNSNDETIAVGYMPFICVGESVKIAGKWSTHPDYGEQLKVEYYERLAPKTMDAIRKYLSSGIIKGIRESTAEKIVDTFGTDTLSVIETTPHRLAEIKGISIKKANEIALSYMEKQEIQNIVMFLQKYGVSTNFAMKSYKTFGKAAIEKISENPYILCDEIEGIGFKTADEIATNMSIAKNSVFRIKSGIKYLLSFYANSAGHTCLPRASLLSLTSELLSIEPIFIENALTDMLSNGVLFRDSKDDVEYLYLSLYYMAENHVAIRLKALSGSSFEVSTKDFSKDIKKIEDESGITLDPRQKNAVLGAISNGLLVITGGPGTGKTTTINTIIKLFTMQKLGVLLAAPTGRAAKRMSELTGIEAKTIHRLLEVEFKSGSKIQTFARDEHHPLEADVIIIDETSMIDILLMNSLLKAITKGTRLILVGDIDQLPSVGAGSVLGDIIGSEICPVARLETIFRQAKESMIVVNAHRINHGEVPICNQKENDFFFMARPSAQDIVSTISDLVSRRLPNMYKKDPRLDIQVITPMKKSPTGAININEVLQHKLNPPSRLKPEKKLGNKIFRLGDKVMQMKNNYDITFYREYETDSIGTGIFNGDIGIITEIDTKNSVMTIVFDDDKMVDYPFDMADELDLCYAMTVHKSQGNEFPIVVMPVINGPAMLLTRNLFYTAVTRAKQLVVLVGSEHAIKSMVDNNSESKRFSGLGDRLKGDENDLPPLW